MRLGMWSILWVLGLLGGCAGAGGGVQERSSVSMSEPQATVRPLIGEHDEPTAGAAIDTADRGSHANFVRIAIRFNRASGVIIRPGLIVTTAHAVLRRDGQLRRGTVIVTAPTGESTVAHLLAFSRSYDLALLSVGFDFGTPMPLAAERVRLGQQLVAAGDHRRPHWLAPGQVRHTDLPTLHRFIPERSEQTVSMFAVSARTSIGYSGGPMIDSETGLVYGITVGAVDLFPDPSSGVWLHEDVALAMHIVDVLEEVERLLTVPLQ